MKSYLGQKVREETHHYPKVGTAIYIPGPFQVRSIVLDRYHRLMAPVEDFATEDFATEDATLRPRSGSFAFKFLNHRYCGELN